MRWPPFQHVFFDCDSTLTAVEGIDVLAAAAGKGWRVGVLTAAAMNGDLRLEEIYAKRLRALKPTRGQILALRQVYKQNVVADAAEVIAALHFLGHRVYIVSGGLADAVSDFGVFLGVPRENVRAVGVEYDHLAGEWWRGQDEEANPADRYLAHGVDALTVSDGKIQIIRAALRDAIGQSMLVGDGVSDLLAGDAVRLFVGFGGVVARKRVREQAAVYLSAATLAPVLALAAGPAGLRRLHGTFHEAVADRALGAVGHGALNFNDEQLRARFDEAYQAVHSGTD